MANLRGQENANAEHPLDRGDRQEIQTGDMGGPSDCQGAALCRRLGLNVKNPQVWPARCTTASKKELTHRILGLCFGPGAVLYAQGGKIMIDPNSRLGRDLKAAEEFFELARTASSPFMCAYYRRIAERYLSSEGELRSLKRHGDTAATIVTGTSVQPP
jgi:hypothetical protein